MPLSLVQIDDGYQTAWGDWSDLKPGVLTKVPVSHRRSEAGDKTAAVPTVTTMSEEEGGFVVKGGFTDMRQLADDVKASGFEAGVWLAPAGADKYHRPFFVSFSVFFLSARSDT